MAERITTADAARILGVTPQHVHNLDDLLEPERVGSMRLRVYDRERVALLAAERAANHKEQP